MSEHEREFKKQFIVQFLACWVATSYNDACIHDRHEILDSPPVEDAELLADSTWAEMQRHGGAGGNPWISPGAAPNKEEV